MRIGHGYDVHRLVEGRKLVIGGVLIPNNKGLLGHSDADVLVHAVIDSLLGASGLGDIGKLFPDSDEKYKDIDSLLLLERAFELIKEKGFKILNIDATIVAERPKMAPYIDKMKGNIAKGLYLKTDCVNIKATTEEGLGFTGNGEGISAHAVSLLIEDGGI